MKGELDLQNTADELVLAAISNQHKPNKETPLAAFIEKQFN